MAASECPLNCSNFRKVDNRTLPKATLSQHFKILREAGLIRSERKGVEIHNTTRCAELKELFGDMLTAILNTYAAQNSRRENGARDRKLLNGALIGGPLNHPNAFPHLLTPAAAPLPTPHI